MELHEALKQIINTSGTEVLTQLRVVNILSDLQAYQTLPSSKFIISSMINEGYMLKLLQKGKWDYRSERLITVFVNNTGFQHDLVSLVFQSVAVALSWKADVVLDSSSPSNNPKPNNPNVPTPTGLNLGYETLAKKSDAFVADYVEKSEDYLNSLIEIKGDWKRELGVKIIASSQYKVYMNDSSICLNFEVSGCIKKRIKNDIFIHVVFYNQKGKIIDRSYGFYSYRVMNKAYNVITTDPICETSFKTIGNIKQIVVYWELSSTTL